MSNPDSGILPAYSNTFIIFMKYYFFIAIICGIGYVIYKYGLSKFIPFTLNSKPTPGERELLRTTVLLHLDNNPVHTVTAGTANRNDLQQETPEHLKSKAPLEIHYLYWTGGFDSTFRLCEMLINEKKIVQPIYVAFTLDNNCETEETCNKLWVRRNRTHEKRAMLEIRKQLNARFLATRKRLLPTIYIDKDIEDSEFNQAFESKFYANNLWPGKRKKHQYLFLSKYAYYHKIYVDIGVLGIHNKTALAEFLKKHLKPIDQSKKINGKQLKIKNYGLDIPGHYLEYLRFPLFGRTKEKLLLKARNSGYEDILKKTWSCWFPNPASGKPCGKCPMCRERIITHPDIVDTDKGVQSESALNVKATN